MSLETKKEIFQCWVALILTAGEFTIGIVLVIHDGHFLALYLAFTYLFRETAGGRHYHVILINALHKLKLDKLRKK